MLWLMLVMNSATVFSVNYPKVFGSDWTEAERYVREHHEEWKKEFDLFGVDSRMAEAIVFPELIRYSRWKDEIEKAAVNGLYVKKGRDGADFSVGRFQMKPSFAEDVERAWNASSLAQEYGFSFNMADNAEARRSRVRRLGTEEGQCRYLAIFIRLCNSCVFPNCSKCRPNSRCASWLLHIIAHSLPPGNRYVGCITNDISIPMSSKPAAHNSTAMPMLPRVLLKLL